MANNTINDLIKYLETMAPLVLQESYDNCGLITGNRQDEITGVLTTLDCTEEVVEEAINRKCNVVVAHHPIIFKGLKKITGANYVERTIIKAIKNNIAIYAIHTNLDQVDFGVNDKIADKLSLINKKILAPIGEMLLKLVAFVPLEHLDKVKSAVFAAGAGHIGAYDHCSFSTAGTGTFKAGETANPFVGEKNKIHAEPEARLEVVMPAYRQKQVIEALLQAHPYEEVAYDIYKLENTLQQAGMGMIGELTATLPLEDFLEKVKKVFGLKMIKYTHTDRQVKKVAVCGGAGSFLLSKAIASGADAFITSDFKYHEFFDAEKKLAILDIGHYESEFFTKELLSELILKKFPTFAVLLSEINTNPVNYY
jgi:dinuclear metal center YbgI/SA1388 family protein